MGEQTKVTGVILAGGLARRMDNCDKGLVSFRGQPMVSYAIAAMTQVADQAVISANRNIAEYAQFGLPIVSDQTDSFDGPLAGMLAAMVWAETGVLLVMPCDSPLVDAKHLRKLLSAHAENDADVAVAFDGERLHPVFLAIKAALMPSLQDYLHSGQRKIDLWLMQHQWIKADFSAEPSIFMNINTMAELSELEAQATGRDNI
jgi:molybdenum cofactor guanylyltransferase